MSNLSLFSSIGSSSSQYPPEKGLIRVDKLVFRDEQNNIWRYKGATQFPLLYRHQVGESIDDNLAWHRRYGFNVLRVFPQFTTHFPDFQYPSKDIIHAFIEKLAKNGLRTELTAIVFPDDENRQRQWLQDLYDTAKEHWNVLIEIYNEPEMHGYGNRHIVDGIDRHGIISSYGYYVLDEKIENGFHTFTMPARLDYVTSHGDRGDEWTRKAKDILEYRDGFSDALGFYEGEHCPVVQDEPIGAAENNQPGRRSNKPDDFESYVGISDMFGSGVTYHSDAGLNGLVPNAGSVQDKIAARISQVHDFIPVDTQLGNYEHPRELEDPIGAIRVYKNGQYYVAAYADSNNNRHAFDNTPGEVDKRMTNLVKVK